MTITVNLFGPPGAGKSTTRAGTFHHLKLAGINCEEVYEYAKKLTWTHRHGELGVQPYVFGKQLRDMEVLIGQVDVIVTDSPLLLSKYYGQKYPNPALHPTFFDFVTAQFKMMGGLNYFIERVKTYNPKGRNQTEDESDEVGIELRKLLDDSGIDYKVIKGDTFAPSIVASDVLDILGKRRAA